jgi:hypothetical protein
MPSLSGAGVVFWTLSESLRGRDVDKIDLPMMDTIVQRKGVNARW